jgi:Mrp family chromosome partitioning ATPase
MASLIVVSGPPGAGKSTVAAVLADLFEHSALVAGDVFFEFVVNGWVPPWLPGSHDQNEVVTQAAATAAGRYCRGGYDTVYDGVVGPWYLDTFVAAAGVPCVHYAVLLPPAPECVARVAGRTGHGFTDEAATRDMHAQFAAAAIDTRYVLGDATGSAAATARAILRRTRAGLLRYP